MAVWDCQTHVRMTSSVERTDLDFKISVALISSLANGFHSIYLNIFQRQCSEYWQILPGSSYNHWNKAVS